MADTTQETCTDVIVRAMENGDNMEQVIVIWKLKNVDEDESGIGWSTNSTSIEAIGLIEMTKHGILNRSHD